MSKILDAYTANDKSKKEFASLPPESKAKIIEAAIIEKTSGVMAREIAKGIIRGTELEQEHIYNEFVSKIDSFKIDSVEWIDAVDKLLSYIRVKHLNYIANQSKIDEKEGDFNDSKDEGLAKP